MKTLANKITSGLAGAVVLLVGGAMAGLGLAVIAFLALFALAAIGLALLAKPFVAMADTAEPVADTGVYEDARATA